jgi:hypothetical protein
VSYVTDVVLIMPLGVEEQLIQPLNAWLKSEEGGECGAFADIGYHGGGRKAHQVEIYSGALNYLPLEAFLAFIAEIPVTRYGYDRKGEVMLIIRDEDWRAPVLFRLGQTLADVQIPKYE